MDDLATIGSRIKKALRAWNERFQFSGGSHDARGGHSDINPVDALRRECQELEADIQAIERERTSRLERAADLEMSAMDAVRRGDDGAALEALAGQKQETDRIAVLDAEWTVVQALLTECADVLRQAAAEKPPDSVSGPA